MKLSRSPCSFILIGSALLLSACGGGSSTETALPATPFTVSTLAGRAAAPGSGSTANIDNPRGVATDAAGNIYAAELFGCAILKITPAGRVTTLAGGGSCASVDGVGAAARFNYPKNLTVDKAGNVFVTETQNIRKVTPTGVVTTPYGSGTPGLVDAAGAPVQAFDPWGIAVDDAGTLYVSAQNSILKITRGGVVTTLAGNATAGYVDGAGSAARFSSPRGIALDAANNVYVADENNSTIRKVTPQGQVTSLLNGKLSGPIGVAVDVAGNVYATGDRTFMSKVTGPVYFGGTVYIITSAGMVTKVGPDSSNGNGPVDGPPSTARFNTTQGIAVDGLGNIYVAESGAIRKITP